MISHFYEDRIIVCESVTFKKYIITADIKRNYSFGETETSHYLKTLLTFLKMGFNKKLCFPYELIFMKLCNNHLSMITRTFPIPENLPEISTSIDWLKKFFEISKSIMASDLAYERKSLYIDSKGLFLHPSQGRCTYFIKRELHSWNIGISIEIDDSELFEIRGKYIIFKDITKIRNQAMSKGFKYGYILDYYASVLILCYFYMEYGQYIVEAGDHLIKVFGEYEIVNDPYEYLIGRKLEMEF